MVEFLNLTNELNFLAGDLRAAQKRQPMVASFFLRLDLQNESFTILVSLQNPPKEGPEFEAVKWLNYSTKRGVWVVRMMGQAGNTVTLQEWYSWELLCTAY